MWINVKSPNNNETSQIILKQKREEKKDRSENNNTKCALIYSNTSKKDKDFACSICEEYRSQLVFCRLLSWCDGLNCGDFFFSLVFQTIVKPQAKICYFPILHSECSEIPIYSNKKKTTKAIHCFPVNHLKTLLTNLKFSAKLKRIRNLWEWIHLTDYKL